MHFIAHINPASLAHKGLRNRNAKSTTLAGVDFRLRGLVYQAEGVTPAQADALREHEHVVIETMGMDPAAVAAPAEEPPAPNPQNPAPSAPNQQNPAKKKGKGT